MMTIIVWIVFLFGLFQLFLARHQFIRNKKLHYRLFEYEKMLKLKEKVLLTRERYLNGDDVESILQDFYNEIKETEKEQV